MSEGHNKIKSQSFIVGATGLCTFQKLFFPLLFHCLQSIASAPWDCFTSKPFGGKPVTVTLSLGKPRLGQEALWPSCLVQCNIHF